MECNWCQGCSEMSFYGFLIEMTRSHCDWRQSEARKRPIIECSLSQTKSRSDSESTSSALCHSSPPTLPPLTLTTEGKATALKTAQSLICLFFWGGGEGSRSVFQRDSKLKLSPAWGAGRDTRAHLSIFTVVTKYVIHCHLLYSSTCWGAAAAKWILLQMLLC